MEDFKAWLKCVLKVAIVVAVAMLLGLISYFVISKLSAFATTVLIVIILGGTVLYAVENNK